MCVHQSLNLSSVSTELFAFAAEMHIETFAFEKVPFASNTNFLLFSCNVKRIESKKWRIRSKQSLAFYHVGSWLNKVLHSRVS